MHDSPQRGTRCYIHSGNISLSENIFFPLARLSPSDGDQKITCSASRCTRVCIRHNPSRQFRFKLSRARFSSRPEMQHYSSWFLVSGDSPRVHTVHPCICLYVCTYTANDSWIFYADCMQSSHVPLQFSLACSFVTIFHHFPRGLRGVVVARPTWWGSYAPRRNWRFVASLSATITSLIPLPPLFLHSFSQTSLDSPPRFFLRRHLFLTWFIISPFFLIFNN